MKKQIFFLIILSSFVFVSHSQTLTINGISYRVDTLENHQVGPGTQYVSLRLTGTNRLDVFFLKTDLTNPHIQIRTALGRDSIYSGEGVSAVAKRKSTEGAVYFAGTNGDFYATSGYIGYPVSGNMVDSEITRIPGPRNTFIIDDLKTPDIGVISYTGDIKFGDQIWPIHSVNHLRGENQLVLFNQYNGKYTRTNSYGTEVLIELLDGYAWGTNKPIKAKVTKIEKGIGGMAIPKGQAVLSGHGMGQTNLNNLQLNDEIEFTLGLSVNSNNTSNFTAMTGGDNYAMMLKNGNVEQTSIWNELHPRTGLGYSQNRDTLILCVVDGRGVSAGVTTKQLAELMKSAGAHNAFNMDGGGSSTMYISEYGKAVNRTSDGSERAVANGVYVVSTAPADNAISRIVPYEATSKLPYLGEYIPKFKGYNQYGVLLNSDLQDVVLTCPPSLGTIEGNKLIADGSESGELTATYNGNIVATINIEFTPVTGIKIRLDSVLIDNRRDYPIEVLASTTSGDVLISADAFTWDVENSDICTVEKGVLKAIKNGTTILTGKLGDVSDQIKVIVAIPSAAEITSDSLKLNDWTISASSFLNVKWNTENLPANWETGAAVNFTHSAGRAPFIKLTNQKTLYGLPDTVRFVMNIGDIDLLRAIFTMKSNDSKTSTYELNTFAKNKDFSLDIPVDKLVDANDRAVYPLQFDNVNFYLDAAQMTASKAYSMAIKEISLVYRDFVVTSTLPEKLNFFEIYPNPVGEEKELRIRLLDNDTDNDIRVKLFDLTGKMLKNEQKVILHQNGINFSLAGISSGNYLLQITSGEKNQTVKVILK